jgi:hypothetical protein
MKNFSLRSVCSILALVTIVISAHAIRAQKMTVEELISKHRDSIGTAEKLSSVKERMGMGLSEFESKFPSRKANGKAIVASRGDDYMFLVSLSSQEYPFEKIGYFSNKVNLPFVSAGARSPLGAFISEHEKMLTTGVFTGTISGAWPLLDSDMSNAKLKLAGKRKAADRDAYVLEYWPKGMDSAEFTIILFFDTESFRHVRTEYRHTINPSQDTFGTLGRQAGVRQSLVETFSDFKTVDGLTLPYAYNAHYTTESNSGTYEFFWRLNLQQYLLNPNLAANFFTFDTKAKSNP